MTVEGAVSLVTDQMIEGDRAVETKGERDSTPITQQRTLGTIEKLDQELLEVNRHKVKQLVEVIPEVSF